ncbi:MAG: methylenetetrahydrofolate reductase, partial [Bacillota bacterium]|nr:methylenetetrahydrofolate reductase [Bacillota bacterium]
MKIVSLYSQKRPVLSFEVFPPKYDAPADVVVDTLEHLSGLSPDFISVTFGAGGSNQARTLEIAEIIKHRMGLEALAHLTCVCMTRQQIEKILPSLKNIGVENILALRGDKPKGWDCDSAFSDYLYASDLITHIKSIGGFCVGAAAYCEGHVEKDSLEEDLIFMKKKADSGADFFITQLFLDN